MTSNSDSDPSGIDKSLHALKQIDFELAYLALLTRQGIKPLSRWEKPLDNNALQLLQRLGLLTRKIPRTVKTGKRLSETIFSTSPGYIELYEERFGGKPIDKSAEAVRFEGFLFGFPTCCVDRYIRHPYAQNDLPQHHQKILFHWACKGCKITPILLPIYLRIHQYVENC